MLIVAPSGSTEEAIGLPIPRFLLAAVMVTGRVALDEDVENATACGSATPRMNGMSGRRSITLTMKP